MRTPRDAELTTLFPEENATRRAEVVAKTLFDGIGFLTRQHGGDAVSNTAGAASTLTEFDIVTLMVSPSRHRASPPAAAVPTFASLSAALDTVLATLQRESDPTVRQQALRQANTLSRQALFVSTASIGERLLTSSDHFADIVGASIGTRQYFDTPRLVLVASDFDFDPASRQGKTRI